MLDDTIYPVTIGADGQVVEIKIVNKYVRGNIHLTKVDSEYPDNKLTGATFESTRTVTQTASWTAVMNCSAH